LYESGPKLNLLVDDAVELKIDEADVVVAGWYDDEVTE
jgi:hypothetical protein